MSPAGSKNAPEAKAREKIDASLVQAGWLVQDRQDMNLTAGDGIAVREFKLEKRHGYVDYLLFVDHTVDLIATGTDIKPIEIVMFMRSVQRGPSPSGRNAAATPYGSERTASASTGMARSSAFPPSAAATRSPVRAPECL
jgi:hypothetical protein